MTKTEKIAVGDLKLDLRNFRTLKQTTEAKALKAIIAAGPDRFWGLTRSLIDDGYVETENILVLDNAGYQVFEGNRRITALKLLHGLLKKNGLNVPEDIAPKLGSMSEDWKRENATVPCLVFSNAELPKLKTRVHMIHGKLNQAGRDPWNSVAKARYQRDEVGKSEHGLDLLESFLKHGTNISDDEKATWAGDYPLTVLDEALKRLPARFGATDSKSFAAMYPTKIPKRADFEKMLKEIGLKIVGYKHIREEVEGENLTSRYGFPAAAVSSNGQAATGANGKATAGGNATATTATPTTTTKTTAKARARATTDSRSIRSVLKGFHPVGKGREKVVTLTEEAWKLNIDKTPLAFCFVLRSMFETSAKAFCKDQGAAAGLKASKDGNDRKLVDVLRDITKFLTDNGKDKDMQKRLHGAMADIATADSLLSVTSMNNLVHSPSFSVTEHHVSTVFHNVFPLLEEMNK